MTEEGLGAISRLSADGIRINCTLISSLRQPGAAGGTRRRHLRLAEFVGRLDDGGQDGMEVVREAVQIFETYHLPTQVLAASLRHPQHVTQAALAGAHAATIPPAVLFQMVRHPLTDLGIERFLADAAKYTPV